MRLPTHHPGPGLNRQHLSSHHVVAAAALQVRCTMGKRTLIQVIYPLLQLYWFLVRPKTFGVQCVIQQGDAILLVRNTYGRKQWTFPGGSIARGESAEAAIRREVREEVSLPLQQLQHLGAFDATIDYKRDHVEVFAGVAPDRQVTLDPAEILEARWFQPEHVPSLAATAAHILEMWHRAKG
jgi:ADP-ribose pyrophosphatase YjhB (NUDIX family)